ncbi:MAG: hypothetical protein HKM07_02475 [Chlamydiae bacterium]|nr:hypothetical protein [Chlamydiota bacterium]
MIAADRFPLEILAYIISLTGDTKYASVCKKFKAATDHAKLSFLQTLIRSIGLRDIDAYKRSSKEYEILQHSLSIPENIWVKDLKLDTSSKIFNHVWSIYVSRVKTLSISNQLPNTLHPTFPLFGLTRLKEIRVFEENMAFIRFLECVDFAKEELEKANFNRLNINEKATHLRSWIKNNNLDLGSITILDLEGASLLSIPPEIRYFTNLTTLLLKGNSLLTLPIELAALPNLSVINVENNPISIILEELTSKEELEIILS